MKWLLLFGFSIWVLSGYSQYNPGPNPGEVRIIQPRSISELLDLHKRYIKEVKYTEGFRIQIFNTNQLQSANKVKADFTTDFPEVKCLIQYFAPSYKIRAGGYLTKAGAYFDLQRIRKNYPDAFLVIDKIKLSDLP